MTTTTQTWIRFNRIVQPGTAWNKVELVELPAKEVIQIDKWDGSLTVMRLDGRQYQVEGNTVKFFQR